MAICGSVGFLSNGGEEALSIGGNMPRITAAHLQTMTRCLKAGDVVFLPRQLDAYDTKWVGAEIRRRGLVGSVLPEVFHEALDAILVMMLQTMYAREVEVGRFGKGQRRWWEPPWAARVPAKLRGALRRHACEMGARRDVYNVMHDFTTTGIEYVILDDGLVADVVGSLGIWRLNHIKQLGNLMDPCISKEEPLFVPQPFRHTRYMHVLDTMAIATVVARNVRLSRRDRVHLRTAALIHDALMPAHGDETKLIDLAAFDEDMNIGKLLTGPDWEALRRRRRLSRQLLIDTVQSRGQLGALLDVCDKIAYVSRDVDVYIDRRFKGDGPLGFEEGYIAIREQLMQHPEACRVWQDVELEDGRVVFADADRLWAFLKLRVMLFRELYYNPAARFSAFVFSHVLSQYLYDQGKVSRDNLIRMTDNQLDDAFAELTGRPNLMGLISFFSDARVECFATLAEAQACERRLLEDGVAMSLIEETTGKIKPGTSLLVRQGEKVAPFFEAEPVLAEEIEALSQFEKPVRIYYLLDAELDPVFKEALLAYRRREAERRTP